MSDQAGRKYQVFVSSTFRDLEEPRKQAIVGITDCRHIPISLDRFAPENANDHQVIQREIEGSQVYLMILGARYGESPRRNGKSYVELEYHMAERAKCYFIVFAMDWKEVESERARMRQSRDKRDRDEASPRRTKKLLRLYRKARSSHYWKPWSQKDMGVIRRETALALTALPHKSDGPLGFVREKGGFRAQDLVRVYSSSEIVRDILIKLNDFAELDEKLGIEPEKKKALARAFVQQHGDDIARKYRAIFLESGSTVAMIARELSKQLSSRHHDVEVRTNNAFAFMFLWLCKQVSCVSVPPGPPDAVYAGTYGDLTDRSVDPDYSCPPLEKFDPEAARIVRRMAGGEIFTRQRGSELVLAAASGLQVSSNLDPVEVGPNASSLKPFGDRSVIKQMERHCRGFHVGSYYNKLFKRALYQTGAPTVVFIHDDKVDCPIVVPKCHFICDQGYTWGDMAANYPLSIWVVSTRTKAEGVCRRLKMHLRHSGWEFSISTRASTFPVIIGHNAAFRRKAAAIGVFPRRP